VVRLRLHHRRLLYRRLLHRRLLYCHRLHRLHRRRVTADRILCSSTGISRTSHRPLRTFSTMLVRLTRIAVWLRLCWQVTLTGPVRFRTMKGLPNVVTLRFVNISRLAELLTLVSRAKASANRRTWYRQPMAFANCRTAVWKSLTVPDPECDLGHVSFAKAFYSKRGRSNPAPFCLSG